MCRGTKHPSLNLIIHFESLETKAAKRTRLLKTEQRKQFRLIKFVRSIKYYLKGEFCLGVYSAAKNSLCLVTQYYSRRWLCNYFSECNEQTCFSKNCKLEKLKIHSFALIDQMEKWIIGQHLTNFVPHVKHFTLMATCTRKVLEVDWGRPEMCNYSVQECIG